MGVGRTAFAGAALAALLMLAPPVGAGQRPNAPPADEPVDASGSLVYAWPGPTVSGGYALASGSIPGAKLRRRTFTIELHGTAVPEDEGARVMPAGTLVLRLRRGRIHQTIQTVPAGALQTVG